MSGPSKIEWTEQTWNPIAGCSIVSPGCSNCYAMRQAARIERMGSAPHYAGLTKVVNGNPVWTGKLAQAPDHIWLEPLQRRKPTMYFVNSMSDLFHEDVPDEWIDRAFAVMALCPQHTFQVLTKRSERMRRYVTIGGSSWRVLDAMCRLTRTTGAQSLWPVPNVWVGVSAERQREADQRIPDLLATYAAVRFVSAEPLLGPIDLNAPIYHNSVGISHKGYLRNKSEPDDYQFHSPKFDWVIVGGEFGPGARPMHPDWARSIRDQCQTAGIAFFFKQWGAWWPDSQRTGVELPNNGHATRVGKKAAGRLLDGREWNGMPTTPTRQHARTPEAVA